MEQYLPALESSGAVLCLFIALVVLLRLEGPFLYYLKYSLGQTLRTFVLIVTLGRVRLRPVAHSVRYRGRRRWQNFLFWLEDLRTGDLEMEPEVEHIEDAPYGKWITTGRTEGVSGVDALREQSETDFSHLSQVDENALVDQPQDLLPKSTSPAASPTRPRVNQSHRVESVLPDTEAELLDDSDGDEEILPPKLDD